MNNIIAFPGVGYVGEGSVIRKERVAASLARLAPVAIVVARVHFERRFDPAAPQQRANFQWVVEDVEGNFHFVISSNDQPEPAICPDDMFAMMRDHYRALAYPEQAATRKVA